MLIKLRSTKAIDDISGKEIMKPAEKKYILDNVDKKSIKKISEDLGIRERKVRKFLEKKDTEKHAILRKEKPPVNKVFIIIAISVIIIAGFIAYANSLNGKFIWDDEYLIKYNSFIRDIGNMPKIFTNDIAAGSGRSLGSYRPLQILTYVFDYSFYKLNTFGYHLTNTVLHILVAIALFCLLEILFRDTFISLVTSVLYLVFPVHTGAVSYISGRADSLSALFMLLSFIFYIKNSEEKEAGNFTLMLLCYAAALLSRESSIILPVLLLIYSYTFKKKIEPVPFITMVSLPVIYIIFRLTFLGHIMNATANIQGQGTLFDRLPGFFVAITNYIRLLILPVNLHAEYGKGMFSISDPRAILGIIILIALITTAVRKRNTDTVVFFGITWFIAALLPMSNIFPINAYMAEHWLYVPSMGFALILAKGVWVLYKNDKLKVLGTGIFLALVVFYSSFTIQQNGYWKDPITFYERTMKYAPFSVRVHSDLGRLYANRGQIDKAVMMYKKAISIDPGFALAYNNLGIIYKDKGNYDEAVKLYKKAIEIDPRYQDAMNNLAVVYMEQKKYDDAIMLYNKAIEINPGFEGFHCNLGNALADCGRTEEALKEYQEAIRLNPVFADAYYNMSLLYSKTGKEKEAEESYKKAMEINPGLAKYRKNKTEAGK